MVNEEILNILAAQGIKKGDILLVSSDVTKLILNLCGGIKNFNKKIAKKYCNDIIDTLQELIGKEGTLLFPTYNWGWCKGKPFIYEKTLGETGALGNTALKREDFKRTRHPIYSFAVWGKDQELLDNLENVDSFGEDSPFAYLYHSHAKNLFIDVEEFYTFSHYVEESVGVYYRFIKKFKSCYEVNSEQSERTYSMYVRDLDINVQNNIPLDLFEEKGCLQYFKLFNVKMGIIDMYSSFKAVKDDILYNHSKNLIKLPNK